MSLIGNIGPYEESEKFATYVDRVCLYFEANEIADDRKVSAFLSIIGPKLYSLTKDLVSPKSPKDCTFKELVQALENHYKPQVIIIYERFKFYKRNQESHESVSTFVAALKSLAATCNFGDKLEEMLRDRLVMSLRNESTQRVLLTEKDLTFTRAVEIAVAREAAEKDAREFSQKTTSFSREVPVNAINLQSKAFSKQNLSKQKGKGNAKVNSSKPTKPCSGCGKSHWKKDCPFKDSECYLCKKKGHIAKVCFAKKSNSSKPPVATKNVGLVEVPADIPRSPECKEYIFTVSSSKISELDAPYLINLKLNGSVDVEFQLDSGAGQSLMSEREYWKIFPSGEPKIVPSSIILNKYGGSKMLVKGHIRIDIGFQNKLLCDQVIVVVKDKGPNLLGRDLMPALGFRVSVDDSGESVHLVSLAPKSLLDKYPQVFEEGLGTFKDLEVSFDLEESVAPRYFKARNVQYAMRPKVDVALDKLLAQNIIQPVTYSKWAAPIVPVLKEDGSVRICGDYRLTVNRATKLNNYPVPRIEDLFATLGSGKIFSKLDLSNAYNQILLSPESRPLTTVNTHRGLFQYNRLCFGIASAPGIFQRAVEDLLRGIPGVCVFFDDILVSASNDNEHEDRVCEVLGRLQDVGLKLHPTKCSFGVERVKYLGYSIDSTGLKPTDEKLEAILQAPEPQDLTQLRSYLGMLNFYRKFLVNAAVVLEPLNNLLRKDVPWKWTVEHSHAFKESKSLLLDACLIHFDPTLPIIVSADSSKYGLGAVLCHKKDGEELPVVFASRTLNKAERNYTQTEKEALALVFALKRFHHYLWGHKFTLITDHKPLLGLFNPDKPIPEMASGRIQRWSLMLQAYSFELYHRSGKSLGTADALSRLPLAEAPESVPVCNEWINLVNTLDATPVTSKEISKWSAKDPIISQVLLFLEYGWPEAVEEELKFFFHRKDELSMQQGCLLWGSRVVVPQKGRESMLNELHQEHLGSTKMKQLARSYFWWPGLDSAIEELSRSCPVCLATRDAPKKAPLHPWDWPEKPWVRVHVDYAGPVNGTYFLVLIDAHSKWLEVLPTKDTSSSCTINLIRKVFSQFGLPLTLVSDNGSNFVSREFELFLEKNGVRHITSAPYQPSTNGQAENSVKTLKSFLKHCAGEDWRLNLDRFLFQYRVTPHSTTGVSPAELMFGRKLRTVLDLVHPEKCVKPTVLSKQKLQKDHHDSKLSRELVLQPESPVMVRNYSTLTKDRWIQAKVLKQTGPVSYKCKLPGGAIVRRHQDQILTRSENAVPAAPMKTTVDVSDCVPTPTSTETEPIEGVQKDLVSGVPDKLATPVRRSTRVVKPPDRLDL